MVDNRKKHILKVGSIAAAVVVAIPIIGFTNRPNRDVPNGEIILYNSHINEKYKDKYSIMDATKELEGMIKAKGINCEFVTGNAPKSYADSFEASGKMLQDNVKNLQDKTLIDIHIGQNENNSEKIEIILASKSPNYEDNLKVVELLLKEISNKGVDTEIVTFDEGINMYNQNLSKHGIMINVGTDNLKEKEVESILNILGESINETISKL